jgi:hypothetical protein
MKTLDDIATRISALLGMPLEYAYLSLGTTIGVLIALLVRRARRATESTVPASLGVPGRTGFGLQGGIVVHEGKISIPLVAGVQSTTRAEGVMILDGKESPIDGAALSEAHELVLAGRKLDAIKRIREATQLGLAEAKVLIDGMESLGRTATR